MEELTKHTLKIVKTFRTATMSLPKKITEIFLEIIIITFAISLGQYLEKKREENAQQREVKEFLLGFRYDLNMIFQKLKTLLSYMPLIDEPIHFCHIL
jgi:hypothetical protein